MQKVPHPVAVSMEMPDHNDEKRLLQQSYHSTNKGLEAS